MKDNMSKINIQYSNAEILKRVFRCRECGYDLLMFGCKNSRCKNFYKSSLKRNKIFKI